MLVGTAVEKIDDGGARLRDGSFISAGLIVNSAGSWSPALTRGLEVKKRKGHLVITDRYPNFVRHQLVELGYLKSAHSLTDESVAFNIQPTQDRTIIDRFVATVRCSTIRTSTIQSLRACSTRAVEYLPALGKLSSLRTWTGFRAATPDKLPLIGPHAEHERLYLATGHEGLGITTSLATAKLLVGSNYESRQRDSSHALFTRADGTGAGACLRL